MREVSVRFLTERPLHVAEELHGLPLASPLRLGVAFAVDLAIVIVPSVLVAPVNAVWAVRAAKAARP